MARHAWSACTSDRRLERVARAAAAPRAACWTALVATILATTLVGCDTIGQDVSAFFTDLTPPSPQEAAEWALDPYDAENRRRGITLLSTAPWGGSEAYMNLYRDRVTEETDPQVLAALIRALARHGNGDDAVLIVPHLDSDSREVRWEAAQGLQRLHNPVVSDALAKHVTDPAEDSDVRSAAANALGQYPNDGAFQALAAALDARELDVNLQAEQALVTLTGEDFGLDRAAWLAWYDESTEPFAGQLEYRYPTFSRPLSVWDHMAFWSPKEFETPGVPAGLEPEGTRTTYQDEIAEGPIDGPGETAEPGAPSDDGG